LKRLNNYKQINEIIITENGAAFDDIYEEDGIDDFKRVRFLQDYIAQVLLAKREGVKVNGYFVWTLHDNFEWAEGYYPKFGLVNIDFKTQKRTVKNSGRWYSQFLNNTVAASGEVWESKRSALI
jgi:beta-glucosidase